MSNHNANYSAQPRYQRHKSPERDQMLEIFIGGLHSDHSYSQLYRLLAEFGMIDSLRLMHYQDGQSRGFGFVRYSNLASVRSLLDRKAISFQGKEIECKLAFCKTEAKLKGAAEMSRKLFVTDLQGLISENQLAHYFRDFGIIKKVQLVTDQYGFITFVNQYSAKIVLKNGTHTINGITICCKAALSRFEMGLFRLAHKDTAYGQYSSPNPIYKDETDSKSSNYIFRSRKALGHPNSELHILRVFEKNSRIAATSGNRFNCSRDLNNTNACQA